MTVFSKQRKKLFSRIKFMAIAIAIAILIIAIRRYDLQQPIATSFNWMKELGPLGPIVYILIYNIATLLFIPGSVLTIKGGCIFGVFWGSIYVIIAAIIGAVFAFLVGRYLSRDWVAKKMEKHPRFQAIDRAVGKEGWKIVLLTRLSPIFPFNLLNYAFGVTKVSLKDYILGSLGLVPGTLMYVYMGSLLMKFTNTNMTSMPVNQQTQIIEWGMRIIGLLATIGVTVYMTKIAQKALHENINT
jgi:uncharacterized membrane protein YdjX (TVP38/TMEM64 family)